jgi:hypothetical protein
MYEIEHIDGNDTISTLKRIFSPGKEMNVKRYHLIDKKSGQVVGQYDNYIYAVNRAKFKFKRQMRYIDRMLLGKD